MKRIRKTIKQRLIGIALVVGSVLATLWVNDLAPACMFAPFGLWMVFTKEDMDEMLKKYPVDREDLE